MANEPKSARTPPAKKDDDKKPRGPVNYLAFVEREDGSWWLAAADRESSSALKLRGELLAELEAEGYAPDTTRMVIMQTSLAQVVEHKRETIVKDTFKKTELTAGDASITPPPPLPPADTEAGLAARAAASPAPPDAIVGAGEAAAQAAHAAEAEARAAAVPPLDPDDDEREFTGNPDLDPVTGISRRSASEATPADEGNTVFPIEGGI